MGLYPDLLPGYVALNAGQKFAEEWGSLPQKKGLSLAEMAPAIKDGRIAALFVVGANPADLGIELVDLMSTVGIALSLFQDEAAFMPEAGKAYDHAVPVCQKIVVVSSAGPGWFADFVKS